MRHVSKVLLALAVLVPGLLLAATAAQSSDFPSKPITLVIPWGAGGSTDIVFRSLCEAAQEILGQPILVTNRPGDGGAVGVGSIVGEKPDGYTLVQATNSLHRNSHLNKLSFDTVKDLTPIILVGGHQIGVAVRSDSPFAAVKDVIDYARANPGKLTYMASGVGSSGHVAWEETAYNAGGLKFRHLPSKGDKDSSTALLDGRVDMIVTPAGWIPLVEEGKLKLLCTFGEERLKTFPEVPTAKELGLKVVHENPMGIFGPKGMDPKVVKILHDTFRKAQNDPRFIAAMGKYEIPIEYMGAEDYTKYWSDAYVEAGNQVNKFILNK
ncbi:MAG: Bug family tripartite tricarboxylate transporter substrate binding protein [Desulfomonilaceae bacterium]